MILKKLLKITGFTVIIFVGFVIVYLLSAYCLSRIEVSEEKNIQDEVAIYIMTNGVHTDIVMPLKNDQKDWSQEIRFSNITSKDTNYNYVGMGWGDKGFYLQTPTWADLKTSVALKAATGLSTTAMHTTFFRTITEDSTCKKILISKEQYKRLLNFIDNSFQKDSHNYPIYIHTKANYGSDDTFYEANGSYSIFYTCNTWANNALKACGQKSCLWTPFDTGIFLHYN